MKVGIAGYMGAGKSTCARAFVSDRAEVIDADAEAKLVMTHSHGARDDLRSVFGESVVGDDGALRFDELGRAAFSSAQSLRALTHIVRPYMIHHFDELMRRCRKPLCILDAALIPLWGAEGWFDFCMWVDAPFDVRYERLKKKLVGMDASALKNRMLLQEEVMPVPSGGNWVVLPDHQCAEYIIGRMKAEGVTC